MSIDLLWLGIVLTVVLLGLLLMAGFSYYVYQNIFVPNTGFNNQQAHVYIPTGATFKMVAEELSPLLKDMSTFKTVAHRNGGVSPMNILLHRETMTNLDGSVVYQNIVPEGAS